MKRFGALLIAVGSAIGLAIAVYNFFSPAGFLSPLSNTSHTPGALLVVVSSLIMLVFGLLLLRRPVGKIFLFIALLGILLDILGTGFAALLLESLPLLAAMAVAGLGWLAWMFGGRSRAAA